MKKRNLASKAPNHPKLNFHLCKATHINAIIVVGFFNSTMTEAVSDSFKTCITLSTPKQAQNTIWQVLNLCPYPGLIIDTC